MSDLRATVKETKTSSGHAGFHVEGYEKIEYDFTFIDGVFNIENPNLADCYKRWQRCLAVTDVNIYNIYGKQMEKYFEHHGIVLKVHKTKIGEKAKTIPTLLSIVDAMVSLFFAFLSAVLNLIADRVRHHSKGTCPGCWRWLSD
jgi:3-dehydroquinate synthase